MSVLKAAMQALDLGNATAYAKMGLKSKQFFDVFGAYFRGVEFPKGGQIAQLAGLPSNVGLGIARGAMIGGLGLGTWNALPRSNHIAVPAGVGAGFGAAMGLNRFPSISKHPYGLAIRAGGGLLAGSLTYQGLRATTPQDYRIM